ncbi:MAG: hypothetical protein JXB06_10165 [Spirochaetales bacterium]|nr:hypothetical protein [Spirochaetales bacterium]
MRRSLTITLLLLTLLLDGCSSGGPVREPAAEQPEAGREAPETSLPAPHEVQAAEVRPAEEPTPPEIGYHEAVRQISRLYPSELQPLILRGRIPIILHDLDNDHHPEGLSPGVPAQGIDSTKMIRLGDSARLFQEDNEPVAFSLLVFANNRGNFRRLTVLDLGEHVVFENLRSTALYADRLLPVIITVSFQSVEGREAELLVFDNGSGQPRCRLALAETLSSQYRLADIDGNGMTDLLVIEKAMEEGTGLETFLTWHRWNGRSFVEYRTRNVVRNLNAFLASATELLLAGEIRDAVGFLLEPSNLRALRRRGWSDQKILIHIMGLEEVGLEEFPALREVIFPPLLEDPFTAADDGELSLVITYRMIDLNGTSYIAKARLYMLPNPFIDRQFAFSASLD